MPSIDVMRCSDNGWSKTWYDARVHLRRRIPYGAGDERLKGKLRRAERHTCSERLAAGLALAGWAIDGNAPAPPPPPLPPAYGPAPSNDGRSERVH